MNSLWKDLQFSLRTLKKSPGFTILAVLALALGIGANTAIFSVVHSLMFRPLPGAANPDELVSVVLQDKMGGFPSPLSYPTYQDYSSLKNIFVDSAGWAIVFGQLRIDNNSPVRILFPIVTGNFFQVLGVKMHLGRSFSSEEMKQAGSANVVILGYNFWKKRFDANPSVVGSTVRINGSSFTIIGVLSKEFRGNSGLMAQTLYVPITAADYLYPDYAKSLAERARSGEVFFIGRLRKNVTHQQAQTALNVQAERLEKEFGEIHKGQRALLFPEPRTRLEPAAVSFMPPIALIFMTLVGLVLLAACANVASLLYARASGRQKEIAIRMALGSSRIRILRQLLFESLLLALFGSIAGIALAFWLTNLLGNIHFATDIPLDMNFTIDSTVLGYALLIAVFSGVLAGLMPGLRASNTNLVDSLKEGGRTSAVGAGRQRLRDILLVTQVAVSLVLLVCAGLFLQSTMNAVKQDIGMQIKNRVVMAMDTELSHYDKNRSQTFYRNLLERVHTIPGIESVALGRYLPIGFQNGAFDIFIEGKAQNNPGSDQAFVNIVSSNYFKTVEMPVLQGRAFNEKDLPESKKVAIVNEAMAKKYWPAENPLGKKFRFDTSKSDPVEIVGVVKTAKYVLPAESPLPAFYLPYHQNYRSDMVLHIHTLRPPAEIISAVRSEVRAIDPEISLSDVRTMEEHIRYGKMRLYDVGTGLIGGFGFIALALSAVGLYGVMALLVTQRTHEIGVRMALGASQPMVLRMIVLNGLKKTLPGLLIGVPLAIFAMRAIQYLLVGVSPTDLFTLSASLLFLIAIALIASIVPAWRASRVDPLVALHNE
ncbi:ABC transporter permease [bacterium]|nr:ABC transporter permease [bacterium]